MFIWSFLQPQLEQHVCVQTDPVITIGLCLPQLLTDLHLKFSLDHTIGAHIVSTRVLLLRIHKQPEPCCNIHLLLYRR